MFKLKYNYCEVLIKLYLMSLKVYNPAATRTNLYNYTNKTKYSFEIIGISTDYNTKNKLPFKI